MFGYIKPHKPEMKVKEFDTFQSVYCGLCKQLRRSYGPFASLTLSYDFTFMAVVGLSMEENCTGFTKCFCPGNPLKRKACVQESETMRYCASAAMLMLYYKVKDNLHDAPFFKKAAPLFLLPFAALAKNKAKKAYPEADRILSDTMREQAKLERANTKSIDRAADPTATALAKLCESFSADERQKVILNRFGYLVGRYVYFMDALDDLEEDEKRGGYNPFLASADGNLTKDAQYLRAQQIINLTIGEIARAYELLDRRRYIPILDNIIYEGFKEQLQVILLKKEKLNEKPI